MAFSPDLGIIPLVWAILTFLNILFCYFYAVAVGHVYPFVPSISNTGAKRPEGNIFAEGMNISSFVCLLIMAIRYHQLKYRAGRFSENLERVNCLSLISGLVNMFGVTLIANFPSSKDTTASTVHEIGAVLLFVAASCYCVAQTFLTWKLFCYGIDDRFSWIYRLILTCIMVLAGILFLVFSMFAYQEFKENHSGHDILKWKQGDGGYDLHVFSNVWEWVGTSSFILFIMSYFKEFQEVHVVTKCLSRNRHAEFERETLKSEEIDDLPDSS